MSLREEMYKYELITGKSSEHVPIIELGSFLDGYDAAIEAVIRVVENYPNIIGNRYSGLIANIRHLPYEVESGVENEQKNL